jgi:hypothetical protein
MGERKRGNLFGKNRIMIRPKDDGTYMTGAFRSKLILRGTISPITSKMAYDDLTKEEGSIEFWLHHSHVDWSTNNNTYKFPNFSYGPISGSALKNADGTITVTLSGPFDSEYMFCEQIPSCDERGLHVVLTWCEGKVILYLNATAVREIISSHAEK